MTSAQPGGIAGVFDRAAETYEAVGVPWFEPINERVVRGLRPRPGERVLDIGCGRGASLLRIARAIGERGQAVGIDLAPSMVAATRRDVASAGLRNVELHVMDASAPVIEPAGFDAVNASLVLFFLPDPVAALRGWRGLLRPGGRLVVSSFRERPASWAALDDVFALYRPATDPDQAPGPFSDDEQDPFASDAGVERLLADGGFTDVRTSGFEVTTHFADVEQWFRWQWSHGGRALWERIPESAYEGIKRDAAPVLERCRDAEGRITLTQGVRLTLGNRPPV
jgi:ubiquinone/menaquinone biosynthesis C-methylase UbiE